MCAPSPRVCFLKWVFRLACKTGGFLVAFCTHCYPLSQTSSPQCLSCAPCRFSSFPSFFHLLFPSAFWPHVFQYSFFALPFEDVSIPSLVSSPTRAHTCAHTILNLGSAYSRKHCLCLSEFHSFYFLNNMISSPTNSPVNVTISFFPLRFHKISLCVSVCPVFLFQLMMDI